MSNAHEFELVQYPYALGFSMLKVPEDIGELVTKHVKKIFDAEFAWELSGADFYHGHILVEPKYARSESLADVYTNLQLLIYHTRELLDEWDPDQGEIFPRSIIGRLDGSIGTPLPTQSQFYYDDYGTIFGDSPFLLDGEKYRLSHPSVEILVGEDLYHFDGTVVFTPQDEGRFCLRDGTPFEVYFRVDKSECSE